MKFTNFNKQVISINVLCLLGFILFPFCEVKSTLYEDLIKNFQYSFTDIEQNASCLTIIQQNKYWVYKVVDGDTFWMKDAQGNEIKVRLIGIDAPETQNRGRRRKGYYAEESKQYLQKLIGEKSILVTFDVQKYDRYNRILAYVWTLDGVFVNANLVENGYAVVATFPPNVKYAEKLYLLQKKAQNKRIGIWKYQ